MCKNVAAKRGKYERVIKGFYEIRFNYALSGEMCEIYMAEKNGILNEFKEDIDNNVKTPLVGCATETSKDGRIIITFCAYKTQETESA